VGILLGAAVAPAVFGLSWWGGRTLARHYSDGWEVLGALVVACAMLAPGVIWGTGMLPLAAVACGAGLLGGYDRRTAGGAARSDGRGGSGPHR
jgi:hypothetical protein